MARRGLQQRADAVVAVRHGPLAGDEVRVVVGHDLLVGRHDHAVRRVEAARQRVERHEAGPVVARIPPRRRREALQVVVRPAQRHAARRDIADIAVHIGIDDVLLRRVEVAHRRQEGVPVARGGQLQAAFEGLVVRAQRGPLERHHVLGAQRLGGNGQRLGHVGQHRAVARGPDGQGHVRGPLHADGLGAGLELRPAVRRLVAGGVRRIDPFYIEVLHVRRGIGETPGNARVMAEHDQRNAGQRGAGHIEPRRLHLGEIPE
ncbi:hypothetical protein D3C87_1364770 [compost metagenome]